MRTGLIGHVCSTVLVISLPWVLLQSKLMSAEEVSVRHAEGLVHGFPRAEGANVPGAVGNVD
jgi:hypothetical protein